MADEPYHTGFVPLSAEDEAPPPEKKKPVKTTIWERKKNIDKTIDDIEKGT